MKKIIILGFILFLSIEMFSFDGKREGFVLGGGIGITTGSYDDGTEKENYNGLGTNLKIGYSFDGVADWYYFTKVSWIKEESKYTDKKWDSTLGIAGIGYTRRIAKKICISGGVGISRYTFDWKDTKNGESGFGGFIGGGYDINKNINIGLDFIYGDADKLKGSILMMTLNGELF